MSISLLMRVKQLEARFKRYSCILPVLVTFISSCVPAAHASAQQQHMAVKTGTIIGHDDWRYWELVPDLEHLKLIAVRQPGGGAPLERLLPPGALAAINGGFFQANFEPTGWVMSDGKVLSKRRQTKRGGVIALRGSQIYIGPESKIPFEPLFAIHNSPLLLEPGARVGIRREDGRRAARTLACLGKTDKKLHLIVILAGTHNGPTLMELATLLKRPADEGGFDCDAALNFDGGSSSGVWLAPSFSSPSALPIVPISYGIVIEPK